MGANIVDRFTINEMVRILKYKREKSTRIDPVDPAAAMRVRRDLFGVADRYETEIALNREMDAIQENNMGRWNFDFVNERPTLPTRQTAGPFNWVRVAQNNHVAAVRRQIEIDSDQEEDDEELERAALQKKITQYVSKRKQHPTTPSDVPEQESPRRTKRPRFSCVCGPSTSRRGSTYFFLSSSDTSES